MVRRFEFCASEIFFLSQKIHIFKLTCNFRRSFGNFIYKLNRARREMTSRYLASEDVEKTPLRSRM